MPNKQINNIHSQEDLSSHTRMKQGVDTELKANAHLIASAHEMYEALKAAIDFMTGNRKDDLNVIGSCKDALAKANGIQSDTKE